VLWHQVEEAEGRQNVSVKRVKDELLEKTAVYSGRFDALDEQLHAARALAAQHKCESVERDTLLDGIPSLLFTHKHTPSIEKYLQYTTIIRTHFVCIFVVNACMHGIMLERRLV
jgi:hypothetical protein